MSSVHACVQSDTRMLQSAGKKSPESVAHPTHNRHSNCMNARPNVGSLMSTGRIMARNRPAEMQDKVEF